MSYTLFNLKALNGDTLNTVDHALYSYSYEAVCSAVGLWLHINAMGLEDREWLSQNKLSNAVDLVRDSL